MTVYSTSIQSTAPDAYGRSTTTVVSDRVNEGDFLSSEDLAITGPTALDAKTGIVKAITSENDLLPTDVINVGGIPMTVKQAREIGVSVSGLAAVKATRGNIEVQAKAPLTHEAPEVDLGPSDFTTDGEMVALDTMVDAVRMHTRLDRDATIELGQDIALGDLGDQDPVWDALGQKGLDKESAKAAVGRAVSISQDAAKRDLGAEGYAELTKLANGSRTIREMVVQHGAKRMNGEAKLGWNDVLQLARQFART